MQKEVQAHEKKFHVSTFCDPNLKNSLTAVCVCRMPRLAYKSYGARHRLFDREQRKPRLLKPPARRKTRCLIT